jgi:hypothetical protein
MAKIDLYFKLMHISNFIIYQKDKEMPFRSFFKYLLLKLKIKK